MALKFLPEGLDRDSAQQARIGQEVRVARQILHPKICRVHDLLEVEGMHLAP